MKLVNSIIIGIIIICIYVFATPLIVKSLRYDRSDSELNALVDECNALGGRAGIYPTARYLVCDIKKVMEVNNE